jgi:serine/threonine protein kinase
VFQVRNTIDSRIYAMKVVRLSSSGLNGNNINNNNHDNDTTITTTTTERSKILREAKVLSSLRNNNHVVRYYSAWVEKGEVSFSGEEDGSFLDSATISDGYSSSSWKNSTMSSDEAAPDSAEDVCNLCQSIYRDWEVSFEHWGLIDSVLQPLDLCIPCYKKSIPDRVDASKITIREKQQGTPRLLVHYHGILRVDIDRSHCRCRRQNHLELLFSNGERSGTFTWS